MKKTIVCCLCLLICAALCQAQGDKAKADGKSKTDFNGTWVMDKSKSDFGRFSNTPLAKADTTMVIAISEPEFRLERDVKVNGQEQKGGWLYYTDGRGETNASLMGAGDIESKTKWDGGKLVSKASMIRQTQRGPFSMNIEEKWEVSKDGKTLTDTVTVSNPRGTQEIKQVYSRAQP